VDIVKRYDMRMVGPNCMGIINADPAVSMNATFTTVMPPFGHAAFVSQSGALGLSVLDYAREYGIGISQFVSVGNKPDVSSNDLLLEWESDPSVKVVLMYVESFGNPRRFLEIASRLTKAKPIIVVKSGRSGAGARAATSHTGALAASDTAVDAMIAQAGVLRASTVEELFDMAMAFGARAMPRSRRTAVLTNAGGPGILAADALETHGLQLVDLSPSTVEKLRPLFPPEASIRNPLDMIASATPTGYQSAMQALLADPAIDAVVPIFVPPFGVKQEDVASAIVGAAETEPDKTILAVLMGREGLPLGRAELHDAGIPAYIFPESAARALAALNRHVAWSRQRPVAPSATPAGAAAAVRCIVAQAASQQREYLSPSEVMAVLAAYDIPMAAGAVATCPDQAAQLAAEFGFPVAMKVVAQDLVHKTDAGGVMLGIRSAEEARSAFEQLVAHIEARAPDVEVEGVLVQRMVQGGREMIAGISRDANFGAMVMFGAGGIFVEALRDVIFRLAPVDEAQAREMITGVQASRLLEPIRGLPAADRAALARAIVNLSRLATDVTEIQEIDVNPLMALPHDAVAVDARIRIRA
jgi:acyl-CoA synthetase (NDP forming)